MDTQQHSFRRADGSVLTIRSTTGEGGVAVIEVFEAAAPVVPALEPEDE